MINKTVLVGRLTRDPEVKMTDKGVSVVNFTLAVNRQFNKEQADFIDCVAWRNQADFLGNYIKRDLYKPITKMYIDVIGRVSAKIHCRICDHRLREKDNYCAKCGIEFDWSELIES